MNNPSRRRQRRTIRDDAPPPSLTACICGQREAEVFCPRTASGLCAECADNAWAQLQRRGQTPNGPHAPYSRGARRRWAVAAWFGLGYGRERIVGNPIRMEDR